MPISKGALKWRSAAAQILSQTGVPLPVELVLSIIDVESSGHSGAKNPKSGASGLMQVMPITLETYNQNHKQKFTIEDLRNPNNPASQLKTGIWVLALYWKKAYNYLSSVLPTVDTADLMKIADLYYSTGPGAIKPLLKRLTSPTYQHFAAAYPNHGGLPHARKITDRVADSGAKFNLDAISDWLEGDKLRQGGEQKEKNKTPMGALAALGILCLAWWYFKKKGGLDGD